MLCAEEALQVSWRNHGDNRVNRITLGFITALNQPNKVNFVELNFRLEERELYTND